MSTATTIYNLASALQTTTPFTSSDFTVGSYTALAVDINITGNQGSSPTIQYFVDRKGADGIYYPIWQSISLSSSSTSVSTSIGIGVAINQSIGAIVRFRWTIGGSSTPGFTFSVSIQAE